MTGLRGRAGIAAGALIIAALGGFAIPAATTTGPALAATTAPATGVDVSPFTTISSWTDVQQAGASFAGDEAAFAATPESTYATDAKNAVQAGLYVMPYAFVFPYDSTPTPNGNGTVAQQAAAAVNTVNSVPSTGYEYNGRNMRLPLVVDIEPDPYYQNEGTTQCYGLSPTAMVSWLQTFIKDVSSVSKTPLIYTTADFWDTCTGDSTAFIGYPLWLASYDVTNPALPVGWNNYTFWQYTDSGSISGISGATDLDYLGPVLQVSQAGKAIAPVQLRTLTSLAGTASTYSSSSLPAGLAISSSGQISGTPTTADIGTHTVTVSTSGVPSSISFTWIIHGALTVTNPGNHTTTAGTPVWRRIAISDQDGKPSISVSGLPPGLAMDSTGLITGWPTRPGTYTVHVSASDSLYASASTTFTWVISAAADSGFTGRIRQSGGTAKCLDDPSGNTANGTKIQLYTCLGNSNQTWTTVQDGTIRVRGHCLAASGSTVELWGCSSGALNQEWRAATGSELVNAASGLCLYYPNANAGNGSKPTMATCGTTTTQSGEHWGRPVGSVVAGDPGKCMAVSGSTVELANCANVAAQYWAVDSNGTIGFGSKCLTESGTTAGSSLVIGSCGAATTKWTVVSATGSQVPSNPIATEIASADGASSGLCVASPANAAGAKLILQACSSTTASLANTWHIE